MFKQFSVYLQCTVCVFVPGHALDLFLHSALKCPVVQGMPACQQTRAGGIGRRRCLGRNPTRSRWSKECQPSENNTVHLETRAIGYNTTVTEAKVDRQLFTVMVEIFLLLIFVCLISIIIYHLRFQKAVNIRCSKNSLK